MARYLQLATISAEQEPQVRTVVFRGFVDSCDLAQKLLIATDVRSQKINEIEFNARAQVCWYFSEQRLQFRLLGHAMSRVSRSNEPERKKVWNEMSSAARIAFFANAMGEISEKEVQTLELSDPPPNFAVIVLNIDQAEVLDISVSPHRRTRHIFAQGEWTERRMPL